MNMETITSRDNSLLKLARSVREGKTSELIFVEGLRLCEEALHSGLTLEALIVSEELAAKEKSGAIIAGLADAARRTALVSEKLLESISYTKTPQGIIVLASRPETSEQLFAAREKQSLLVVMHRINNPVNVGAILRTAEAAGASGAIATQNTTDPFSPKALRGAMGSAFRLPIWFGPTYDEAIAWLTRHEVQTVCADVHAAITYDQVEWINPSALIVGPESSGLSPEEIARANMSVRIPMHGPAESLNVAVATGVLLYEAARQRQNFGVR
ncbi:MAG TPA: RNA methyltransferase [Pyrinomonadaceae bacterium]|nr:RNA methyltransferase [Pyrinomonadaceae bacterium]